MNEPTKSLAELVVQDALLSGLARTLTRDAEDLVQETRLHMLRARNTVHAPLAWAVRAMRSIASNMHRSQRRRQSAVVQAARQFASNSSVPGPGELAAREEGRVLLIGIINELPSAQRDVIVLQFFEGLVPREIALRLRLSASQVAERRRSALATLRARLDRRFGERAQWVALLLPWTERRLSAAMLQGRACRSAMSGGTTLGLAWWWARPLAATVALIGLLFVVASLVGNDVPAPTALVAKDTVAAPASIGTSVAGADQLATVPRTPVMAAESGLQFGKLEVLVFDARGVPAVGVGMIACLDRDFANVWSERSVTDGSGLALFSMLRPGKYDVGSNQNFYRDCRSGVCVEANQVARAEVHLGPVRVSGVVLDAAARPVPGAMVEGVNNEGESWEGVVMLTRTDQHGRFVVSGCSEDIYLSARVDGSAAAAPTRVRGSGGTAAEVVLRLGGAAGSIEGTVIDRLGRPIRDARICVGSRDWAHGSAPPGSEARSGPEGDFSVIGILPGHEEVVVWAYGHALWRGSCWVDPGRVSRLGVQMFPSGRIVGTVVDASGNPCYQCAIRLCSAMSLPFRGLPGVAEGYAGRDGAYVIEGVAPGEVDLSAEHYKGVARKTVVVDGSSDTVVNFELAWPSTLNGHVLDEEGRPVEDAIVRGADHVRTDEDGRFSVPMRDATFKTLLQVEKDGYQRTAMFLSAQHTVTIRLQRSDVPGPARVTGVLLGSDLQPLRKGHVRVLAVDGHWAVDGLADLDGHFDLEVPPGWCQLVVGESNYRWSSVPDLVLPGREVIANETADFGKVQLGPGARLFVAMPEFGEQVEASIHVAGAWRSAVCPAHLRRTREGLESSVLGRGRYHLRIQSPGQALQSVPFEIADGVDARLSIGAAQGVRQCLQVRLAGANCVPESLAISILCGGQSVFAARVSTEIEAAEVVVCLAPGDYEAVLHGGAGSQVLSRSRFVTRETEGEPVVLRLQ